MVCLLSDDEDDADEAAAVATTAAPGRVAVVGGAGAGGWGAAGGGGGGAAAFVAGLTTDGGGLAQEARDEGATHGLRGLAPPRPDVKPWLSGGVSGGPGAAACASASAAPGGGDVKPWAPVPAGWDASAGLAGVPALPPPPQQTPDVAAAIAAAAAAAVAPRPSGPPAAAAGGSNRFFSSTLYGDVPEEDEISPVSVSPMRGAGGASGDIQGEVVSVDEEVSFLPPPGSFGEGDVKGASALRLPGAGAGAAGAGESLGTLTYDIPDDDLPVASGGRPPSRGRSSSVGVGTEEDPIDVDELLNEEFAWLPARKHTDRKPGTGAGSSKAAAGAGGGGAAGCGSAIRGTPRARRAPHRELTEEEEEAAMDARIGIPSRRGGRAAVDHRGCAGAGGADQVLLDDEDADAEAEMDRLDMAADGGDGIDSLDFAARGGAAGEFSSDYVKELYGQNNTNADATTEGETPYEMNVSLLRHQKRALAWMINREQASSAGPRGGILADEMGLGKTLSTVALILKERPPPKDDGTLSKLRTLVVAPLSVLQVWKEEFLSRIDRAFMPSVLIYHGSGRTKDPRELAQYDIVITSYSVVSKEAPKEVETVDSDGQPITQKIRGALFKVRWFRVVLDEAQVIKNRRALQARAAYMLPAERRWCLSGTPIQNSVDDIYSLFLFLRYYIVDTYSQWSKVWKKRLNSNHAAVRERTFKRFQVVLGTVLLRRTKSEKVDGVPILVLPPKNIELRALQFSPDERAVYMALENKSRVEFNKFVRAGTVMANLFSVLVLLLRLRQACSHPHLITKDDGFSREELEQAATRIARGASLLSALPEAVQKRLVELLAPDSESDEGKVCPICFDGLGREAIVTSCGHFSCGACNGRWAAESDSCPQCRQSLADTNAKLDLSLIRQEVHAVYEQRKEASTLGAKAAAVAGKGKGKGKGKAPARLQAKGGHSGDIERFDDMVIDALEAGKRKAAARAGESATLAIKTDKAAVDEEEDVEEAPPVKPAATAGAAAGGPDDKAGRKFLLSTKIQALMDELNLLRETKPGEKALVYSQWTGMLDLIEVPLEQDGFRHTRIDGSMRVEDRTEAIDEFKSRSDCTVMLMSLHAAGTGLNLTNANHVFMMDMWWNPAVEAQAVGRCHRIGQTKDVFVYRLYIAASVETEILAIQDKKQEMADGALGVEGVQTLGRQRLTLEDVLALFGRFSGEDASAETAAQRAANHARILAANRAGPAGAIANAAATAAAAAARMAIAPALMPPALMPPIAPAPRRRRRSGVPEDMVAPLQRVRDVQAAERQLALQARREQLLLQQAQQLQQREARQLQHEARQQQQQQQAEQQQQQAEQQLQAVQQQQQQAQLQYEQQQQQQQFAQLPHLEQQRQLAQMQAALNAGGWAPQSLPGVPASAPPGSSGSGAAAAGLAQPYAYHSPPPAAAPAAPAAPPPLPPPLLPVADLNALRAPPPLAAAHSFQALQQMLGQPPRRGGGSGTDPL